MYFLKALFSFLNAVFNFLKTGPEFIRADIKRQKVVKSTMKFLDNPKTRSPVNRDLAFRGILTLPEGEE